MTNSEFGIPAHSSLALQGQSALVTGAPHRVGRSIALGLAGAGVNVVVHYNGSAEGADELCGMLRKEGVRAWPLRADFRKESECATLIARALDVAGGLDILVNNASIFTPSTLESVTFQGLVEHLEVNAWAPFALSRDFARSVNKGKIVNLLDSRVWGFDLRHVGYILSKDMLATMTRMTALGFAPRIAVNAVAPGPILPPAGKDEACLQQLARRVPLKRHGGPEDVTAAVLYLISSDYLTGQVIFVDGGRFLHEEDEREERAERRIGHWRLRIAG